MSTLQRHLTVSLLACLIIGCSGNDVNDLQRYSEEVKARPKPPLEPLPEVKTYETFLYSAEKARDPFTPTPEDAPTKSDNGIRPDVNRSKEPLEDYPLDTLKMVGTVERDGQRWSLVIDPDKIVHRVQPNNYMGQNYGKVVNISDEAIELVETIEDGQGGWVERPATLALSEDTAGGQ